jgi:hypothetical protein
MGEDSSRARQRRSMDPASSLRPSESVDSGAVIIREQAARLTAPHRHPRQKVRCLFEYVRDEIP